jgi:hypothetical protein
LLIELKPRKNRGGRKSTAWGTGCKWIHRYRGR